MIIPLNRFDGLGDTDLLACTDDNGVTYKVTGAQFKEVLDPRQPWEDADVVYHVIVPLNSQGVKKQGGGAVYNMDGTVFDESSVVTLYSGEYVITGSLEEGGVALERVFFSGSLGDWGFGDLTDTGKVTDMARLMQDCSNFTGAGVEYFDVREVLNLSSMFYGCGNFTGDVSGWDVRNVNNVSDMFNGCTSFTSDLSGWDVSNVTNLSRMFANCVVFESDLSGWDVSNVTNMSYTFLNCPKFTSNLSRWDVSNVTYMAGLFKDCPNFESELGVWNVSNLESANELFTRCTKFTSDLSSWDISNVENTEWMFKSAEAFTSDLSRWDVSSVTTMRRMFDGCTNFESNLAHWDVAKVRDFNSMFKGCSIFTSDLSWWSTGAARFMDSMFADASAFDTDCSYWCVEYFKSGVNRPGTPESFSTGAFNFTSTKPNWGVTCVAPKPDGPPPLPGDGGELRSDPLFILEADEKAHSFTLGSYEGAQEFGENLQASGLEGEQKLLAIIAYIQLNERNYTQDLLKLEGLKDSSEALYLLTPGEVRIGNEKVEVTGGQGLQAYGVGLWQDIADLDSCLGVRGYSNTDGQDYSWEFTEMDGTNLTPQFVMASAFDLAALAGGDVPLYSNNSPKLLELDRSFEMTREEFLLATGQDMFRDDSAGGGEAVYLNYGLNITGVPAGTWVFVAGDDHSPWVFGFVDEWMMTAGWATKDENYNVITPSGYDVMVSAWPACTAIEDWKLVYQPE